MKYIDSCLNLIIDNFEGGYVNDSSDPGGETKYGISKRSYPSEDIRNLTKARAVQIFKEDYAEQIHFEQFVEINPRLALYILDCAIHSGPARAIMIMQRSGNTDVDGKIGPKTLRAAELADIDIRFMAERATFLSGLKLYRIYGDGWMSRLFMLSGSSV
jgi:lysozyme family protein